MPRLSLSLLGPFQVTLDGDPVIAFESDKVRALLAYLAVESDRPHRREKLVGLLWPEWSDQAARNSLRFGLLLPAQYFRGHRRPGSRALYARAPLALHAHTTASVALFGDRERSVRLVPALNGVLALGALLFVLRRHWGESMALLAGTIYLLLPTNAIYANMSNHSTGFIFWALIALHCYLRWLEAVPEAVPRPLPASMAEAEATSDARGGGRWLAAFFGASFLALQWDWPAYYVMLAIALHWLVASFDPAHRSLPRLGPFSREHAALAAFCLMTLASFVGFLLLVESEAGNFRSITTALAMRTKEVSDTYHKLWTRAIEPMFSAPLLALGALWLAWLCRKAARHELRGRDLIPVAFLLAGTAHTLIFKRSANIHSYWPWPLTPFLAIAAAEVVLATPRFLHRLARLLRPPAPGRATRAARPPELPPALILVVLALFFTVFLSHALPLLKEGRRCGGVLGKKRCFNGDVRAFLAKRVREMTLRTTRVALAAGTVGYIQLNTTMDRATRSVTKLKPLTKPDGELDDDWVLIGKTKDNKARQIERLAACYPYSQYGRYFLVDFRRRGQRVRIHDLDRQPADWYRRFLVNASSLEAVRDPAAEKEMRDKLPRCRQKRWWRRRIKARKKGRGGKAKPDGEKAKPDGEKVKPDGEQAKPDGEKAKPDGEKAKPGGETEQRRERRSP